MIRVGGIGLLILAGLAVLPAQAQRTWFFSGKVVLEDGSVPPEKVTIESVCGGVRRPETYTDKKGEFHFTLGGDEGEIRQDSSRSGMSRGAVIPTTIDPNTIGDCAVRAVLPGYTSNNIVLNGMKLGEKPDLGSIVLRKISGRGRTVPENARKAYEKGADAAKSNKWADALKNFQKAVELHPQYAEAWVGAGKVQLAQGQAEAARASFDRAVGADPDYVPAYLELANLEARAQNWKALGDVTARVIKLAPANFPQAYLFNAVANLNLGDAAAAESSAREGQKIDTQHQSPKLWQVLGAVQFNRGDFAGAAEQLKKYLEYAPAASDAAAIRAQIADCESQTKRK